MGMIVSVSTCSHAPQIVTRPKVDEEYYNLVRKVQEGIIRVGELLRERSPDVLIMIGADHLESFFLDNYPMLLIPVVDKATGHMGGFTAEYEIHKKTAETLLFSLINQGFDVSFSQNFRLDHPYLSPLRWFGERFRCPIVPIHLNSNVPPLMLPGRALSLGKAIRNVVTTKMDENLRVAVIGTGGLSHFPGTPLYGKVDLDFDNMILGRIEDGRGHELAAIPPADLERSGNLELRTWLCAMGSSTTGRGKVIAHVPTFHIDYAVVDYEI